MVVEPLRIELLGGFRMRVGERTVPPIASRSARVLCAYLVLHRDREHPRGRLATLLWPDLPEGRARRRLSHTLWQLHDALAEVPGAAEVLRVRPEVVGVSDAAALWVDVDAFEQALDAARERHASGTVRAGDLATLEAAVEWYRGDLLAGHDDVGWVRAEQERLEQRYHDALQWLVQLTRSHGAYEDALVYARRLTNLDPLREDAHREVMRLLMLLGRTEDAQRQYERCVAVLRDELDVAPAAATEQLYRRILRHRDAGGEPEVGSSTAPLPDSLPLIGRRTERLAGIDVLEQALVGSSAALLIEAEPGVGKTRLLDELVGDAHWRGFAVLRAGGAGREDLRPYGVIQDLLDDALTPLRIEQLRHRVAPVFRAEVARLAPVLATTVPQPLNRAPGLPGPEGAQRLRDGLVHVLAAIADGGPTVVVVDDLHACDVESLTVLADLGAQAGSCRLVLLVAARPAETRADATTWAGVRELDRRWQPTRLLLDPLDRDATGELARLVARGQQVDPGAVARLHQETGGNPLFVVETLRELVACQQLGSLSEPSELPVPGSIRGLVMARAGRLDPELRAVLDAAAVIGDAGDVALLMAVADRDDGMVVDALDELVRRGLLRVEGVGIHHPHEQLRRAVLEALDGPQSRALHRRTADALEQLAPEAHQRQAHHLVAAGAHRRAVRALRLAAQQARRVSAERSAWALLEQAVGLQMTVPHTVEERVGLLRDAVDVLEVLGDLTQIEPLLAELVGMAGDDPAWSSDALRRRALLRARTGALPAAIEDARAAVAQARQLDDPEAEAASLVALGAALAWSGTRNDAARAFERAAGLTEDARLEAELRVRLATVLREAQRYDDAKAELERSLTIARDIEDLREESRALGVLGAVHMETGRDHEAAQAYTLAIKRAVALGFRHGEAVSRLNLGNVHYTSGQIGAALAEYHRALALFHALDEPRGVAILRINLGNVRIDVLGDDDAGSQDVHAALQFFRELGDHRFVVHCLEMLAGVALRAGQRSEAEQALAAAALASQQADDVWSQTHLLRRRAELASACGDPHQAVALLAEAEALAVTHGLDGLRPALTSLRSRALLDAGDLPGALAAGAEAIDAVSRATHRRELVLGRYAEVLLAAGRHLEAERYARRAGQALTEVLDGLEEADAARARQVPAHAAILEAVARARPTVVSIAARTAPRGRPLADDERVEIPVSGVLADPPHDVDPAVWRRGQLTRLVEHLAAAGGAPTVADLAGLLGCSTATVRRDLAVLRGDGVTLPTRGTRTG